MQDQVNSLQHFQQHSRLHFIGRWKTSMEDLLRTWYTEHPEWNHGTLSQQSLFIHIDMDAFFCSVQLAKPEYAHLREQPVAIAAGKYNSDISSCNYVARAQGVRAGMYVNSAKDVCPSLVVLGYDLAACERATKVLYRAIFELFPPSARMSMEVYSIDEVMLATDTSDYDLLRRFCEEVRAELVNATGCTASCGIGPNIMLSRLGTARVKPNGISVTRREEVPSIMQSLPFSSIHGAGRSTVSKVYDLLVQRVPEFASGHTSPAEVDEDDDEGEGDRRNFTCADVKKLKKSDLQFALGRKAGESFYNLCRGEDARVVMRTGDPEDQRALGKSIPNSVGCSMNYAVRPRVVDDIWSIARQLLEDVCGKLKRGSLSAHGLRITILERHPLHPKETQKFMGRGRCVEFNVSVRFQHPLDETGAEIMLQHIKDTVGGHLVSGREQSDEERAVALGLEGELESRIIWTTTVELSNIVISDVRGMTVQATGLQLKEEQPIVRKLHDGQLSLAASFSRGTRKRQRSPGGSRAGAAAGVHSVESNSEASDGSSDVEVGDAPANSIATLYALEWGAAFASLWRDQCVRACRSGEYPLVKALLRLGALKIAEHPGVDNPVEELAALNAFAAARLPLSLPYC